MPKRKASDLRFTAARTCSHCHNTAPHRVVHNYQNLRNDYHEAVGDYAVGFVFVLMECPACNNITLLRESWHTGMDDTAPQETEVVYPARPKLTDGLPPRVQAAVEAADRVKAVDPNAYGVLVRRALECICHDRGAKGRSLHDLLRDLGARNEIPDRLVEVAVGLKNLGNIGAHAGLGELSAREVPLMASLLVAVLEHVYGAPHLVAVVEQRLKELRTPRPTKRAQPPAG